jgi:hypothetical protein
MPGREAAGHANETEAALPLSRMPEPLRGRRTVLPGAQGFDGAALREVHARLLDRQTIRPALETHPRRATFTSIPCARMCLKQGRYVAVEEVHHIVPLSEGGTNDESQSHEPVQVMPREDPQGARRPVPRPGGAVGISTSRPPGKRRGAFCAKKAKSNG